MPLGNEVPVIVEQIGFGSKFLCAGAGVGSIRVRLRYGFWVPVEDFFGDAAALGIV